MPISDFIKAEILEKGYCELQHPNPEFLQSELVQELERIFKLFPGRKSLLPEKVIVDFATSEFMRSIAYALIGKDPLIHHVNGRISTGQEEKPWHHDRDENLPRTKMKMYHVMVYPRGLVAPVAPLCVVPGSHKLQSERSEPQQIMKMSENLKVVNLRGNAPLVVVLDSALWHARPSSQSQTPRYDLNVSYCSRAGNWSERNRYSELLLQSKVVCSTNSEMFD